MSDFDPEKARTQFSSPKDSGDRVAIAMVIASVIVSLACIVSCTIVAITFLQNAPW